jgi:RNA polymerase sigma factor
MSEVKRVIIFFSSIEVPVNQPTRLGQLLHKAKSGDKEAKEIIIADYIPFILKIAAKVCGRFLRIGEDDEISISLMAFNEAIDKYQSDKSSSFLSFAEMVIRRRLVDFYRKEKRGREILFSDFTEDGQDDESQGDYYWLERVKAQEQFDDQEASRERKEEIISLHKILNEYGISFGDLVKNCPKHEDARKRAILVAITIALNPDFRNYLLSRKSLPLKDLVSQVNVSRKTLERQRKYIIALALILIGDFPYLQDYLFRIAKD